MLIVLLVVTFITAFAVASLVTLIFSKPVDSILNRVISGDISYAWAKYLKFAIYVVGIGSGVRVWDFEKYMTRMQPYQEVIPLTPDRWVLEIYQTIIGTLGGTALVLLVFFVFTLVAVVIVRFVEPRTPRTGSR